MPSALLLLSFACLVVHTWLVDGSSFSKRKHAPVFLLQLLCALNEASHLITSRLSIATHNFIYFVPLSYFNTHLSLSQTSPSDILTGVIRKLTAFRISLFIPPEINTSFACDHSFVIACCPPTPAVQLLPQMNHKWSMPSLRLSRN